MRSLTGYSHKKIFLTVFCFIFITQVTGQTLRITPASKSILQTKIAANFPFDPKLEVEILDGSNNRIVTGADSSVTIYTIISGGQCLSVDSTFQLVAGVGYFPGSICKPGINVSLSFNTTISSGSVLSSDSTNLLEVTGTIWIGYFHRDYHEQEGKYEAFMRSQLEDINEGWFFDPFNNFTKLFTDRTVKFQSHYFPNNMPDQALHAYNKMKTYHRENPEEKTWAMVGFENSDVSKLLLPMTKLDDYSILSYRRDTDSELSDKTRYPNFNRICYSDIQAEYGLALYLKERSWNKIVVINGVSTKFTPSFYTYLKRIGIEVVSEFFLYDIDDPNVEPAGKYDTMFKSISNSGYKVILTNVRGATSIYMYTEAIRNDVTCTDMYQWIGYENREDFPSRNTPNRCHLSEDKLCILRFKGMHFVDPIYFVDGYESNQWDYVWMKQAYNDQEKSLSKSRDIPETSMTVLGAEFGRSRDSISINILAISNLIAARKTISGTALAKEIRGISIKGLTGEIQFDANGDRKNFIMAGSLNWPSKKFDNQVNAQGRASGSTEWWDWKNNKNIMTNAAFKVTDLLSTDVVEHRGHDGDTFMERISTFGEYEILNGFIELPSERYNKRVYKAYKGLYHGGLQQQVKPSWDRYEVQQPVPLEVETREELVPAPYFCEGGCGGAMLSPSNILKFQNGECIRENRCSCLKSGDGTELWTGDNCEVAVCKDGCLFGNCTLPNNCVCMSGYVGVDCGTPVCTNPVCSSGGVCASPGNCQCKPGIYGPGCEKKCTCVHGTCNGGSSGDGVCTKCDSGYVGANCDISLVALCVPLTIGIIVLATALYFAARFFIKRTKLKAALYNNDWIVNWLDFKRHDEATGRSSMFLSAMSMNNTRKKKQINTGVWEGIDVYYQKLDKESVALSESIRLEVKQVRELRHINIAQFVGCSVESPNVCILTELQPKGSLEDIFSNDDIKLPWNFRFSLLKGVCAGLEYLHKSEIISHGRLKSSNCVVDNRWTVKLTGFGLHEFKSGQRNVGDVKNRANIELGLANFGSLIWTAPELLRLKAYHLDHIGRGTVESDVYSFGMLLTEFCTREIPFADVMLEKRDLINMIIGEREDKAMRVWNDYLAKLNVEQGGWVRPCIQDTQWPPRYERRKALKKLMESCWHEDPLQRPTIFQVKKDLEHMDPQRGELMDHLVTMLEKYSSNLEDIVSKRTKQLEKEKQKTDDLISRLLPRSVADELKQGKRVEPVNYESVTIYFSDIVGFTSIAKASTPLEVVALLNDMYTAFDSIAANHDVYKVETIGDAYMIVSGLPTTNGDKHAGEICSTALELMAAIGKFKIAHMPDTQLRLRAGIHTGNVVAGVVGLKMPRYCLFGESVNVASKMESGGLPQCIHVSEDTQVILARLGGYYYEYRHEANIKGRGVIKTYWLTGSDGHAHRLSIPNEDE